MVRPTPGDIRFSYFHTHFPCVEMSPSAWSWSAARETSHPFLQTPVPEAVPFLVPKTQMSKEVECCFPHLSTYTRAQVRQGVRSSTVTERQRGQLSSSIHLSCCQPATELVLPVQHKHRHVPTAPFGTQETWPHEALRGQEAGHGASKPNDLTLLPDCYSEHIP